MIAAIAATFEQPDEFYQQPCWLDVWLATYDGNQLAFWSHLNEIEAALLLSHLESAGFLHRLGNSSPVESDSRTPTRFQVHPTYYSELKFYRLNSKPPVPGVKKAKPVRHTPRFRTALQRIWTSMRILQTFSIGQLQACSDASNEVVRTVVTQLYQLNYVQLKHYCHPYFAGNEDIYQLIRDTGTKAPFLCTDGILYDSNTHCIYQTEGKAKRPSKT
ncbi:MAG: hypothetical protein N4J56_007188 [Chroococcidiopsis sp. SAG 2025]|uniref:hypothetical protein n=1 Tax=Chroococcidiopsis sp. SAG 2025 TaxID=171389 RepID=UPI002936DB36|nr:hypothetical protein [Chroococcidiopsis sp. SAG 2025]MDV2997483.1 hypothetical protein [Chroococcidiopsis sp. SAG 2025]